MYLHCVVFVCCIMCYFDIHNALYCYIVGGIWCYMIAITIDKNNDEVRLVRLVATIVINQNTWLNLDYEQIRFVTLTEFIEDVLPNPNDCFAEFFDTGYFLVKVDKVCSSLDDMYDFTFCNIGDTNATQEN